jgi:hypothetical protein
MRPSPTPLAAARAPQQMAADQQRQQLQPPGLSRHRRPGRRLLGQLLAGGRPAERQRHLAFPPTPTTRPAATAGGELTFNRRSTVSVAGPFGELRAGPRLHAGLLEHRALRSLRHRRRHRRQPALLLRTGRLVAPTGTRASNSVGYFLPANLGGFYGQVMYAMGENDSSSCCRTRWCRTGTTASTTGARGLPSGGRQHRAGHRHARATRPATCACRTSARPTPSVPR